MDSHENLNLTFLRPVHSDEFLPPVGFWTKLGGIVLVSSVGIAITLAAVIKYNVIVKAAATIRPSGELRIVQAEEAGTVKDIEVKENQVVNKGDTIARLDDSVLQIQKSQLAGSIQQSQQQLARIAAQISALNAQIMAESNLMHRSIASAQAELSGNQREYKDKQVTATTETQEAEAALELARVELTQYQKLSNTGAVAQLQVEEKRQAFKAAVAKLQRIRASLNPSQAAVTVAKEQIAQERAKGEATIADLVKERANLQSTQIQTRNQLSHDVKQLQQIGIEISKMFVLAPHSGTILKLKLRNSGQVVHAGDVVAQIAPTDIPFVTKARVKPQDIAKIQVCQQENVADCKQGKVQLRISAYPYPDYGTLKGAVRAIAPDAITPQTGNEASEPYYEITIQSQAPYIVKAHRRYPLKPGMEVTADIISREETVLQFLLRKARLIADT
ncbi:MAG: HlyD family efflux transporter periplasmic adaptor subunit [Chroococcidiopsidaceae cyanobacterium CP_BM_ER_R8_30]|nr:HlyD family efflux transporter periplasmic adaptor subunit [Chroococcidiopsidaceae cyanobacterium CP_BM_ER_R8_30]